VPQSFARALRRIQRDVTMACACLAHRLDNAADGPGSVRCYGSDLTEAEWMRSAMSSTTASSRSTCPVASRRTGVCTCSPAAGG
jgi:hypothetical protein